MHVSLVCKRSCRTRTCSVLHMHLHSFAKSNASETWIISEISEVLCMNVSRHVPHSLCACHVNQNVFHMAWLTSFIRSEHNNLPAQIHYVGTWVHMSPFGMTWTVPSHQIRNSFQMSHALPPSHSHGQVESTCNPHDNRDASHSSPVTQIVQQTVSTHKRAHYPAHLSFASTGEAFPPTHRSWELSRLSLLCFLLLACPPPLRLRGPSDSSAVRRLRSWPFSEGAPSARPRLRSCSLSRLSVCMRHIMLTNSMHRSVHSTRLH